MLPEKIWRRETESRMIEVWTEAILGQKENEVFYRSWYLLRELEPVLQNAGEI